MVTPGVATLRSSIKATNLPVTAATEVWQRAFMRAATKYKRVAMQTHA